MDTNGTSTSAARAVIERLITAVNDHDLDAMVRCFAPDYVNETPAHPLRGFTGSEQVRRNWAQILTSVPDLVAEVSGWAQNGSAVWTDWAMRGNRLDGTAHEMAGVVIFAVGGDRITAARFYLEPVETSTGDVNDAVRAQFAGRS